MTTLMLAALAGIWRGTFRARLSNALLRHNHDVFQPGKC
jgi:hypothetical protein